jgi:hypothetical protein
MLVADPVIASGGECETEKSFLCSLFCCSSNTQTGKSCHAMQQCTAMHKPFGHILLWHSARMSKKDITELPARNKSKRD